MFKNIEKFGVEKNLKGKYDFSYRVVTPKDGVNKSAVIASATSASLNEQKLSQNNILPQNETSNMVQKPKKSRNEVTASGWPGSQGGMSTGTSIGSLTPYVRLLDGIINEDDWITKRKIYRDIYTYDLAGAVVDLFANLPYSDFNLVGIEDKAIIDIYNNSISDLPLQNILPAITVDYLVNGAFLGSLDYRDSKFKYLFPHNLDDATMYSLNLFVDDPIVDLSLPSEITDVLSMSGDPRIDKLKQRLPDYIKNSQDASNLIKLDPEYTLYIPRGGMSTANMGSSYFNRILTIHLVEKALIKGTIESAQRRQRAIMHIQAGIDGVWEPSNEELSQIANLVLAADLDPISGIVVTRNGVEFSDIKAGADFWNWTEIFDFASSAKLEALGVNESILSGDASFNTLEAALSSFMDNIASTRNTVANKVFNDKIFKIVAKDNGFYKNVSNTTLATTNKKSNYINPLSVLSGKSDEDGRELNLPTILWERQLKPKADKDYMDILESLQEKGIPIPLRMFAAAGGENIDDLIQSMDDDNNLKLEIAEKDKEFVQDAVREKISKFLKIEDIDDLVESLSSDDDQQETIESYANVNGGIVNSKKSRNITDSNGLYGPRVRDSEGRRRILTTAMKRDIEGKVNTQINQALKNIGK